MGKYKHVPLEMSASAERLRDIMDKYNEKLDEMQALINNIHSSSAWKDKVMKEAFNDTCNGYMKIYRDRAKGISYNIMKLKDRAKCAEEHERAHTKGGI